MCKINCSCTPDDSLSKLLTQTQQELFLTKGSLMVRDNQLEEAKEQIKKLEDRIEELTEDAIWKQITENLYE